MLFKLLILFIALPIIELWLLFQVAEATSWGITFIIVIGTGIIGTAMARSQGWIVWRRIHESLQKGQLPGDALIDGILILVGGLLLITPGLLTDSAGFFLLIPVTRALVRNHLKIKLQQSIRRGATRVYHHSYDPDLYDPDDVIDVEWEEEHDVNKANSELPEK